VKGAVLDMIEIRVAGDIEAVSVDRFANPVPVVWVPQHSSWNDLVGKLKEHLTVPEIEVAKKIWCEDEYPRIFESREGFLAIRPTIS